MVSPQGLIVLAKFRHEPTNAGTGFTAIIAFDNYRTQMMSVMRAGKTPSPDEMLCILKRLVARIRQVWPKAQVMLRADSHHTKPAVLDWLEANDVVYVLGLSQNCVLNRTCEFLREEVKGGHGCTFQQSRRYHSFYYAAGSWNDKKRRVICRALGSDASTNLRYIVTNLKHTGAKYLYESVYSDRGNAELMIKEAKLGLRSDRSSCTSALANQFRLFLHSAAYMVMHDMRENLLAGTAFAKATFSTIRLRLLKVGTRLESGKTYVRLHMPASFAHQNIYAAAAPQFPTAAAKGGVAPFRAPPAQQQRGKGGGVSQNGRKTGQFTKVADKQPISTKKAGDDRRVMALVSRSMNRSG